MSDYRVTVKVQNNNILKVIQARGFSSTRDFCKKNHLSYPHLMNIINLKHSPLSKLNGKFRPSIEKLCMALNSSPEELFSAAQMDAAIDSNRRVFEVEEAEMKFMLDSKVEPKLLEQTVMDAKLPEALDKMLNTLTPREQKVIHMRFGLGEFGSAHTLDQVASAFDVTRERIRQLEVKALRKMRHPSRADPLRDYIEA